MHTQLFLQNDFADEEFWAVRPKSLHSDIKHSAYELIRAPLAGAFSPSLITLSLIQHEPEGGKRENIRTNKHALIIRRTI